MKANELRIWNLVKYRGENWRISSIFDNGIIQLVRFKIYKAANISEIEPISQTKVDDFRNFDNCHPKITR